MITLRLAHPVLSKEQFYTNSEIQWRSFGGGLIDWANPEVKQLSCLVNEDGQDQLLLMFNASTQHAGYTRPSTPQGYGWHLVVDISCDFPKDLFATAQNNLHRFAHLSIEPPIQRDTLVASTECSKGVRMKELNPITTLFLNIGGVCLLTDGTSVRLKQSRCCR
jgi:hypothetical protein